MLINKYQLIIFDLDGTLVHTTAEYRYYIVPKVLKKLGINKTSLNLIDKFWFDGDRDKTIQDNFKCDKDLFWKVFRKEDNFEQRAKYTHAYDDVEESVKKLKKLNKLLAITTGAPKWIAKIETNLIPKNNFAKITSITSTRYKAKPHPESLLGCLKFCNTKANKAVYIGNSREDSQYAKAAGVDFIYLERREHNFSGEFITTINTLTELFL